MNRNKWMEGILEEVGESDRDIERDIYINNDRVKEREREKEKERKRKIERERERERKRERARERERVRVRGNDCNGNYVIQ